MLFFNVLRRFSSIKLYNKKETDTIHVRFGRLPLKKLQLSYLMHRVLRRRGRRKKLSAPPQKKNPTTTTIILE